MEHGEKATTPDSSQAPPPSLPLSAVHVNRPLVAANRAMAAAHAALVLVVTADPDKEPPLGVLNTVVSAMALDYPGGALSVYLSDDAGSPLTLLAARKAYAFARAWVPFCRRHSVQCPWPDRMQMKKIYSINAWRTISTKGDGVGDDEEEIPALVYVAREKRRAWPHHFKAGALNALLRVSGVVSNAAYVLVLDCDMSCNNRASAMDAMCFLLDRSPPAPQNLAFVQFPQMFHNLSHNDKSQNRWWRITSRACAYEAGTAWGTGVGFMYQSVVEDYFTGYQRFFSRGWTSVYCYPEHRPAFIGSVPTNLNDVLVQNKRCMSGMLAVGVSRRHSPLACRPLLRASLLQAMGYAYFGFAALYAVPVLCYATLPQLCFLRGVPLFPCPAATAAAFASSLLQHLAEVCVAKRSLALRTWWNDQRSGQLFGCVSAAQELLGALTLDFDLTNKAADGRLYQDGVFDFTGCSTLLLPATKAASNSPASCGRRSATRMFLRWDAARVPPRITALSVALAAVLLAVFG